MSLRTLALAALLVVPSAPALAAPAAPQGEPPPEAESFVLGVISFRYSWVAQYPGPDGKLGRVSDTLKSETNPYGRDLEDPAGKDDVIGPEGEIVVPVEKPVIVHATSADYLHSFSVKALKIDEPLVPGTMRTLWFKPSKAGKLPMACTNYCGEGHDKMKATLRIVPRAEFDAWLAAR